MEPALFDTTVWIDFIKGIDNPQTELLEKTISQEPGFVLITPTVLLEILQGLRTESDFNRTKTTLESFQMLSPGWADISVDAARLYFTLRKKGVIIRKSTDCLIARIALQFDVLLVHNDIDFDQIAQYTPLRAFR
jgi:predicted nucleic acid-binding protein